MKNRYLIWAAVAIVSFSLLWGCATPTPMGIAYTKLKLPVNVTSNPSESPKMGTAECKSYFGLVAVGDASIETAMKNGGITKIHYVDWDVKNILGIIGTYKVTVYGE
jgi:hypothetical protein